MLEGRLAQGAFPEGQIVTGQFPLPHTARPDICRWRGDSSLNTAAQWSQEDCSDSRPWLCLNLEHLTIDSRSCWNLSLCSQTCHDFPVFSNLPWLTFHNCASLCCTTPGWRQVPHTMGQPSSGSTYPEQAHNPPTSFFPLYQRAQLRFQNLVYGR